MVGKCRYMYSNDDRFYLKTLDWSEPRVNRDKYFERFVKRTTRNKGILNDDDKFYIESKREYFYSLPEDSMCARYIPYSMGQPVKGWENTLWFRYPWSFAKDCLSLNPELFPLLKGYGKFYSKARLFCEYTVHTQDGYILHLVDPYGSLETLPLDLSWEMAQFFVGHMVEVSVRFDGEKVVMTETHDLDRFLGLPYTLSNFILKDKYGSDGCNGYGVGGIVRFDSIEAEGAFLENE